MDPFLTRFYDEVDDCLADPHSQKRLTKAQRYRDLFQVQTALFERFLSSSGQESSIRRTEFPITLVAGTEFYELPPQFRQFIGFQYRQDGDPENVLGELGTIDIYSRMPGIEIVAPNHTFRVQPIPDSQSAGEWTMTYNKGPVQLHYATAGTVSNGHSGTVVNGAGWTVTTTRVTKADSFTKAMIGETVEFSGTVSATREITDATADYIEFAAVTGLAADASQLMTIELDWCWLVAGTPATDAGSRIDTPGYYSGERLQVYSATAGSPQTTEVLDYYRDPTTTSEWHFQLRGQWSPVPTGTILYEILPEVPLGYDSIYAMDVAIKNTGRRSQIRRRAGLKEDMRELFSSCLSLFLNTTMDRQPQRVYPQRSDESDPYDNGLSGW